MVYLINQSIIFNEGDGTLAWHDRENDTTTLNAPIARILMMLVDNPGVTLSRELLLREVLEKHSLSPSINNLNNYISLLRKVLREFNLADALVTIPKSGVIFHVDSIDIFRSEPTEVRTIIIAEGEGGLTRQPALPPAALTVLQGTLSVRSRYWLKIGLAVGSILLLIVLAISLPSRFPYRQLVKVKLPGKCDIFYLQDPVDHDALAGYQEFCADNSLFFLSKRAFIADELAKKSRIIISCTRQGKGCVTYVDH